MKRNRWLYINLIVILIGTLMPPGEGGVKLFPHADKIIHFILFAGLGVNICYAFIKTNTLPFVLLLGVLLGFTTEVIQDFIPGRSLDFYDALADTLGIASGYLCYTSFTSSFNKLIGWLRG